MYMRVDKWVSVFCDICCVWVVGVCSLGYLGFYLIGEGILDFEWKQAMMLGYIKHSYFFRVQSSTDRLKFFLMVRVR